MSKNMVFDDFIPKVKYDFDDILIEPQVTTKINSRYKDITLPKMFPLFTAPMDMVVDLTNFFKFTEHRINVCLPRTLQITNVRDYFKPKIRDENLDYLEEIFPSIGLNEVEDLYHKNIPGSLSLFKNVLIDVANGHMEKVNHAAWHIKQFYPNIKVMVGNIANPETYRWYAEEGNVDYIRIGIGNGGGCLTTKQSGVGYPMAALIRETYLVKEQIISETSDDIIRKRLPKIVADGGMKDYADVVKALALGADYVMLGSIFNKALESCAPNYHRGREIDQKRAEKVFLRGEKVEKYFRGMSTKGAQKAMGKSHIKTSEGVERMRPVEYTLEKWVENFEHYLRNAMSYSNASTLEEFIGQVPICQITTRAYDRFNK
jgi:hypothetical protein